MKTSRFLFAFSGALLLGCNAQSIQEDITETVPDGQSVTVSLGLGGEITVHESPLSRAAGSETSSQDLYGISVYYDKEKNGIINDPYAYGLFDNIEDMVITLVTGYKYRFICTMVPDGKAACSYSGTPSTSYSIPFYVDSNPSFGVSCSNRFIAGKCFSNISTLGFSYGSTNNKGYLADRYYGQTSNYTPEEGEKSLLK